MTQNIAQCTACEGTVSKEAKTCPHCGQKKPYRPPTKKYSATQWLVALIPFCFALAIIYIGETSPKTISTPDSSTTSRSLGREACEGMIKISVNNPSTLKIHSIIGYGANTVGDKTYITQTFSAKNAFSLEKKMEAHCIVTKDGELESFNIVERSY